MIKYSLLAIFITLSFAFSQDQTLEKEQSEYLNHIAEMETSKQVLQSKPFEECKKNSEGEAPGEAKNNKIRECFANLLDQTDDKQIDELKNELNLDGYSVSASKSSISMRKYLKDRLDQALYGAKNIDIMDTKKSGKLVSQSVYYDLYESQIAKNILMEISNYCLENLRDSSDKLISPVCSNQSTMPYSGCKSERDSNWWLTEVKEVDYKAGENEKNNSKKIAQLMQEEFKKGPEFLKVKYKMCISAVTIMCQRYECVNAVTDAENKACSKLYGSKWPAAGKAIKTNQANSGVNDIKLEDKDQDGQIACVLHAKLKDYRKVVSSIQKTKEDYNNFHKNNKSGSYEMNLGFHKGEYQNGRGDKEKSIQDITSVSSQEIVNEVEEFKNADKRGKELLEKCKGNKIDDECKKNIVVDSDQLNNIEVEIEAGTALEIKKIRELSKDKEKLEAYLEANGLGEYKDKFDELSEELLVSMIADKYKAKRMAVLNRLKSQLENKKGNTKKDEGTKPASVPGSDKSDNAMEIESAIGVAAEEIKDSNDRIENILHYNNIISSYIDLGEKDEDGKIKEDSKSANSAAFRVEKEGYDEFADKDKKSEADEYLQGLNNDSDDESNGTNLAITLDTIDSILGNKANKEEKN